MIRNLIVLGSAGILALAVSMTGFAGLPPDTDLDGVADADDNCVVAQNGPLGTANGCSAQEDGDTDGYGNTCDSDTNNNGATDLGDTAAIFLGQGSTDLKIDVNCNGAVHLGDLARVFLEQGVVPGPSGRACAGSVPCP